MKLGKAYGDSVALNATTNVYRNFRPGYGRCIVGCGGAFYLNVNPRLYAVSHLVGSTYTDLLSSVTDVNLSAGTGATLDAMAATEKLYIATRDIIRGFHITMSASLNANVATLAVKLWDGSAFTSVSPTDGTQTGGDTTLGQTGAVTWTTPTTGVKRTLPDTGKTDTYYWWEITVSATLSADVEIAEICAINTQNAGIYLLANTVKDYLIELDAAAVGSWEAKAGAATPTLYLDYLGVL